MFYNHTNNQELLTNFSKIFHPFVSALALFIASPYAKIAFFYLFPKRSVFYSLSFITSPQVCHPCYPWFVSFHVFSFNISLPQIIH